ncbi:hypothetical protein CCACVL1_29857 [Corchorus capsularis]|uniref:Protein kinase domain-containing protein n=1 Tax=Corchorus capsularis TaxID=210143 RepID=A0A1R3FZR0_COCAP|nr:hypothetical protein CCACVL1_29857 [Corchorus capsularis]
MESKEIREISLEDLKLYTCNFSNDNLIGNFQFGKVYRGKINGDHHVTVKVWMPQTLYTCFPGDNEIRLQAEFVLLTESRMKSHPNLPKLIGYCRQGQLAVVYDFDPIDTLHNYILRDDFSWLQRIKIALQLACLLQTLHIPPDPFDETNCYIVCNIDAAHFVLDKDCNLVLCDFGMFTGGSLPEINWQNPRRKRCRILSGCYGYIDGFTTRTVGWYPEVDVYAFGVILVGLIAKKVFIVEDEGPYVGRWAIKEFAIRRSVSGTGEKVSLVHQSLEEDEDFEYADGLAATNLAMQCLEFVAHDRIFIDQVVEELLKLHVVRDTLRLWILGRL